MPNIKSISCNNSPINCTISKTSPRSDEAETSRIKNVEKLDVSRNNDLVELSREEDGELCSKQILDVGQLSIDSVSKRENNLDFEYTSIQDKKFVDEDELKMKSRSSFFLPRSPTVETQDTLLEDDNSESSQPLSKSLGISYCQYRLSTFNFLFLGLVSSLKPYQKLGKTFNYLFHSNLYF